MLGILLYSANKRNNTLHTCCHPSPTASGLLPGNVLKSAHRFTHRRHSISNSFSKTVLGSPSVPVPHPGYCLSRVQCSFPHRNTHYATEGLGHVLACVPRQQFSHSRAAYLLVTYRCSPFTVGLCPDLWLTGIGGRCPAQPHERIIPHTASLGKDQNSKSDFYSFY